MEYGLRATPVFKKWFAKKISDPVIKARINARLDGVVNGHLGAHKQIKGVKGVYELIFNFAGGFRIYFTYEGDTIVLLLAGGNKSSQARDISKIKTFFPK